MVAVQMGVENARQRLTFQRAFDQCQCLCGVRDIAGVDDGSTFGIAGLRGKDDIVG